MKKRTLWSFLSMLMVISLLVAACGGGEEKATEPLKPTDKPAEEATQPPPPPTEVPKPEEPKILRVRLYGDIQNLDPAFQISENDTVVANAVTNGLVRYCPNSYDICNELAESIEQSEDGLEIRFKLKEGVSGTTATAR